MSIPVSPVGGDETRTEGKHGHDGPCGASLIWLPPLAWPRMTRMREVDRCLVRGVPFAAHEWEP